MNLENLLPSSTVWGAEEASETTTVLGMTRWRGKIQWKVPFDPRENPAEIREHGIDICGIAMASDTIQTIWVPDDEQNPEPDAVGPLAWVSDDDIWVHRLQECRATVFARRTYLEERAHGYRDVFPRLVDLLPASTVFLDCLNPAQLVGNCLVVRQNRLHADVWLWGSGAVVGYLRLADATPRGLALALETWWYMRLPEVQANSALFLPGTDIAIWQDTLGIPCVIMEPKAELVGLECGAWVAGQMCLRNAQVAIATSEFECSAVAQRRTRLSWVRSLESFSMLGIVAALPLLLLMGLVYWGIEMWTRSDVQTYQERLHQINRVQNLSDSLDLERARLGGLVARRTRVGSAMTRLVELMPSGIWLETWSIAENGRVQELLGQAKTGEDLSAFLSALEAESSFGIVRLRSTERARSVGDVMRFSIRMGE